MTEYQEDIRDAFRRMYSLDCTYLETVPVKEVFQGRTVWEGEVEVFAVHGHPKAVKAYGWSFEDGENGTRYVCVLEVPPVNSAASAVRVAIASGQA